MIAIEPKFSEALQGASVRNCYLESGYSGKGQTRIRGRAGLAKSGIEGKWDKTIAAYESSKTRNVYLLTSSGDSASLRVLQNGKLETVKNFGIIPYIKEAKGNFAEMRFLENKYVQGYFTGNYGILICFGGKLWVLDDLDAFNAAKIKAVDLPFGVQAGSVCVVANRIIVSEADSNTWHYSSPGGIEQGEIPLFGELDWYPAEYLNDNITKAARVGGNRLAIFGEQSIELWDTTGNEDDPFGTSYANQVYKIGCLAETIAEISDAVYFCGVEDLSGRKAVYRIDREGLSKLSENPLDAEITATAEIMQAEPSGGKYAEGAANFYLLHLGSYSLAYCIAEKSFSRFYHAKNVKETLAFDCLLFSKKYAVGFSEIHEASEGGQEWAGSYAEKMLALPVYDNGGGHFRVPKITLDMQALTENNNSVVIDYSPDGTDIFRGRRYAPLPLAGKGRVYPLQLWGFGRCNNLKLRIYSAAGNFILNKITIEAEECL
jgi:hypothetical protein